MTTRGFEEKDFTEAMDYVDEAVNIAMNINTKFKGQ